MMAQISQGTWAVMACYLGILAVVVWLVPPGKR